MSVRLISSLFALFLSVALLIVGNGFLMTLLGVRLSLDAVDPKLIGGLMVGYSVGFVLGTLNATRIVQRVGHIRAFAVFCVFLAMAALCYPMNSDYIVWLSLRLVGGFAMAGLLLVIESWFSAIATNDNRSTIFSLYQICFYLATAIAQLLMMLGNPENYFLFSLATMILIAAIVPLGLTLMQAPVLAQVERMSVRSVFAASPLGVIAALTSGVLISAFYGVGPLFANLVGFSIQQISLFMALAVFSAMLLAWPIGWLCDRVDRVKVLFYLVLIAASCSLVLSLSVSAMPIYLVMLINAIFMSMVAAIYPVGVALMNDRVEHSHMISASATLLLSFGVGSCFGPIISATLIDLLGAPGIYVGNTALLAVMGIYVQYRLGKGVVVDVEHQEPFVQQVPDMSPVINELNPMNDHFEEVPLEDIQAAPKSP